MKIRSLLLSCLICSGLCASQQKDFTKASARKIYTDTLNASLKFWTTPEVIDPAGGYHAWFDQNGKRLNDGDRPGMNKVFQMQMRILYSHAMAIVREKDPAELKRLRSQLDHGFAFLDRYKSSENGFYITSLTNQNQPQNTLTRATNQICMIHMMSVIADELKDARAEALAKETFRKFDQYFHDSKSGGYFEYPNGRSENKSIPGMKTTSSNIHASHALSKLQRIAPADPVVKARLEELFRILTDEKILHPSGNITRSLYADWSPIADDAPEHEKAHYGVATEMVWYVLDSAETTQPEMVAKLLPWAEKMAQNVMQNAIGSLGDVSLLGPYGKPAGNAAVLCWWAQTETMVMLAKLYQFAGKKEYFDALGRITRCAEKYMQSPTFVWYSEVDMKTGKRGDQGGYAWKAGMHVIRAMIVMENSLAKIQK